jgi:hypothetical protein
MVKRLKRNRCANDHFAKKNLRSKIEIVRGDITKLEVDAIVKRSEHNASRRWRRRWRDSPRRRP